MSKLAAVFYKDSDLKVKLFNKLSDNHLFERILELRDSNLYEIKKEEISIDYLFIELNTLSSLKIIPIAKNQNPNCRIIVLFYLYSKNLILECIKLEVDAIIQIIDNLDDIDRAFLSINSRKKFMSKQIVKEWKKFTKNKKLVDFNFKELDLTKREIDIIKCLGKQMTAKEIGDHLFISEGTVIKHKSNIMEKIGVNNLIGVILYGIKNKIILID